MATVAMAQMKTDAYTECRDAGHIEDNSRPGILVGSSHRNRDTGCTEARKRIVWPSSQNLKRTKQKEHRS